MHVLKKKKDLRSINLSLHLRKLEREEQFKHKANIRKKVKQ